MATAALAEAFDAPPDDPNANKAPDNDTGDQGGAAQERDFEAEARQHGWVPKDEFKGDPSRWTDAETFVKKADEVMPLLRKKTQAQDREIADLKKQIRRASEHFSKAEERAYERALADLKAEAEKAVADGDVEAFRKVDKKIDDLRRETSSKEEDDGPTADLDEVADALADFRRANRWYDEDPAVRDYADRLATHKYADKAKDMAPADFFAFIGEKVRERFPDLAPAAKPQDGNRRRSAVEGGGTMGRPSRSGRSFNDLPPEAQRMADKWIKSGLIKDRDAYVKSYQWDDK